MATILRTGPYRFFFYSNEQNQSISIHILRDSNLANFWLNPVMLASANGFSPEELQKIDIFIKENRQAFREVWDVYFSC